jgi:sugar lactone lactonase YvrE
VPRWARLAAGEVEISCTRKRLRKNLNLDEHFDRCFAPYPNERKRQVKTMKKNLTETKFKSPPGVAGQLLSRAVCLGAVILICSSAPAQNLFVSAYDASGGKILEFTPNGVRSTFATGLNPGGLAFDSAGNLFVVGDDVAIYKFTPEGVRSTFALGLSSPRALAVDRAGNLFVANAGTSSILKFTPEGVRTTFASGDLSIDGFVAGLAFDSAGNLFVGDAGSGTVYKFTPAGVQTTFASGFFSPIALAFDSRGNLFVADGGFEYDGVFGAAVYKFTPSGRRSTVASDGSNSRHRHNRHRHRQVRVIPNGLAIDSADNLFVADEVSGNILKFTPGGVVTTFAAGRVRYMAFQPNGDCAGCWDY